MQRQLATTSRQEQADQLAEVHRRILNLHRAEFAPTRRPEAAVAEVIDEPAMRARYRAESVRGISVFRRRDRRAAIARGDLAATSGIAEARARAEEERSAAQQSLDALWSRLVANDPAIVAATLSAAFGDNDAAAAPLRVVDDEVTLVVAVPGLSAMPSKKPALTPTGRPTMKALLKREAAELHMAAVLGCALVTVKEAFAVAPGVRAARVFAVVWTPTGPSCAPEVLLDARYERERVDLIDWASVDASDATHSASTALRMRHAGAAKALAPLDLANEPEVLTLLQDADRRVRPDRAG